MQKHHFGAINISSWGEWTGNQLSRRDIKPVDEGLWDFVKGTFNLLSCGFQQTNWETGSPIWGPSRMESWGRKDTKWLNFWELLAWVQLPPPRRKACACSAYLRQEIGKGSRGLAPGKRPGQAPCWTRHRAILISSPRLHSPRLGPQGEWGSRKECGQEVVGSVRAKGKACFLAPWDFSEIIPAVTSAHLSSSERLKMFPGMSSSSSSF